MMAFVMEAFPHMREGEHNNMEYRQVGGAFRLLGGACRVRSPVGRPGLSSFSQAPRHRNGTEKTLTLPRVYMN